MPKEIYAIDVELLDQIFHLSRILKILAIQDITEITQISLESLLIILMKKTINFFIKNTIIMKDQDQNLTEAEVDQEVIIKV